MFRVYYAGKRSKMPNGPVRDDFTNKVIDLTFGWDFYCEHHDGLDLDETHTCVGLVYSDDPEKVFHKLNMEIPEEFSEFIRESDATHTSMSVGDVLVDVSTGKRLFCDRFGFVEV